MQNYKTSMDYYNKNLSKFGFDNEHKLWKKKLGKWASLKFKISSMPKLVLEKGTSHRLRENICIHTAK